MSAGTPTSLVRDGGTESHDDPPDTPWTHDPVLIVPVGSPDSIRRADDAQDEYFDPRRAIDAAETTVDGANPGTGTWLTRQGRPIWKPARRRSRDDDR